MKYAIIKTGGKQYKVKEGDIVEIEKIKRKVGEKVDFEEVLLINDEKKLLIGQPFVVDAKVKGEILAQTKDKKIRVGKYKAKSRYRKKKGHRQLKTRVKILSIMC